MYYEHNIQGCFSEAEVGSILKKQAFKPYIEKAKQACREFEEEHQAGKHSVLSLANSRDDIEALNLFVNHYQNAFDDVVILGTGGSSLGGQTFVALNGYGGGLSQPRLHFMDNIDPHTFSRLFAQVNPKRTGFIVISKSGSTAETLCQFIIVLERWKQYLTPPEIKQHFLVITEPKSSPLTYLVDREEIPRLDHPLTVGGRFSALSLVGLLPAMIARINPLKLREGAQSVVEHTFNAPSAEPMIGAALNVALLQEKNIRNTVLMPYVDCLNSFSFWFRQLWAESLGKDGQGSTPLNALGTVDQHSQLQLYLDGPKDKMFTLIIQDHLQTGEKMPLELSKIEGLAYLASRTMGDLLDAEQHATIATLIKRGCPTRIIRLKKIDEYAMGALMMHFMLETMLTARLLGVNAFDQPAVEEGKVLTREYLKKSASL
ncbi:MAG: glucose-6-phosphate isomerase [Alphaproteobacteria bacterium]|nr:glucose-6-phosphate isomerase [Alphaproteobacteria bacterium]